MVRPTSSARVVTFRATDVAAGVKTASEAALPAAADPAYNAGRGGSPSDRPTQLTEGDMDIRSISPSSPPGRAGSLAPSSPAGRLRVHSPDEVTISAQARAVDAPAADLRSRRLADIKAAIDAGTYETDAKLDAAVDRMLQEIL